MSTQFPSLTTQLVPYLARELSETHEIQDSRRSQGGSPWQGEKRSRSCVAASLFGQGSGQVGLLTQLVHSLPSEPDRGAFTCCSSLWSVVGKFFAFISTIFGYVKDILCCACLRKKITPQSPSNNEQIENYDSGSTVIHEDVALQPLNHNLDHWWENKQPVKRPINQDSLRTRLQKTKLAAEFILEEHKNELVFNKPPPREDN